MSNSVMFAEIGETIERIEELQSLQEERGKISTRTAMIEVMINDVVMKLEKFREELNNG